MIPSLDLDDFLKISNIDSQERIKFHLVLISSVGIKIWDLKIRNQRPLLVLGVPQIIVEVDFFDMKNRVKGCLVNIAGAPPWFTPSGQPHPRPQRRVLRTTWKCFNIVRQHKTFVWKPSFWCKILSLYAEKCKILKIANLHEIQHSERQIYIKVDADFDFDDPESRSWRFLENV